MEKPQLEIYRIQPELLARLDGATSACRHIWEKVVEGEPLKHRVDKDISPGPGEQVALCDECQAYVMSLKAK